MKYIDLHTHSNYSDGTCTPAELVSLATKKGLAAFALTDHDSVAGIDDALTAVKEQNAPLIFVPGTELSVSYKDSDIHMVGLFIDHHNPGFLKASELIMQRRENRNKEMVENLRKAGIDITMEALLKDNPETVITRAHFAKFIIENNYVSAPGEAFTKYLNTDTPYYVPRKYIEPEEGIELIHNAGGIAILAHPLHYKIKTEELRQLIRRLKGAGLDGIEVKYSNHRPQDEILVRHLAQKYDLLASGGSDFHGSNKPAIDIGTGRGTLAVPYEYYEKLAQAAQQTN